MSFERRAEVVDRSLSVLLSPRLYEPLEFCHSLDEVNGSLLSRLGETLIVRNAVKCSPGCLASLSLLRCRDTQVVEGTQRAPIHKLITAPAPKTSRLSDHHLALSHVAATR